MCSATTGTNVLCSELLSAGSEWFAYLTGGADRQIGAGSQPYGNVQSGVARSKPVHAAMLRAISIACCKLIAPGSHSG